MTQPDLTHLPKDARDFQGQPAGIVSRLLSNLVDCAVVISILVGTYLAINGMFFFLDPQSYEFREPVPLMTVTAFLVIGGCYLGFGWALAERTIGCHVMGLRVVGRGGRRIRPLIALIRGGLCIFFPIGLFWCVINPRSRSVQDIVLRTSVVYDWRPRAVRD